MKYEKTKDYFYFFICLFLGFWGSKKEAVKI